MTALPAWLQRPTCRRCGQPTEQCIYYRPAECVGVPKPRGLDEETEAEKEFIRAVGRGHDRQRARRAA